MNRLRKKVVDFPPLNGFKSRWNAFLPRGAFGKHKLCFSQRQAIGLKRDLMRWKGITCDTMAQYNSSLALNVINLWSHKNASYVLLWDAFSVDISVAVPIFTLSKDNTCILISKVTH